jgi:hypothetical protein
MGLSRSNGKRNTYADRLRLIAGELEPVKGPWFVSQPEFRSQTPSMGWWWIPPASAHPAYLGHNHIVAEMELRKLIAAGELPHGP